MKMPMPFIITMSSHMHHRDACEQRQIYKEELKKITDILNIEKKSMQIPQLP